MNPGETMIINSAIISVPYIISIYEVMKNFPTILPKLYSMIYMIIPIITMLNIYIPLPGNISLYLSFSQIFMYYDVVDILIVLFCISTSIMIIVSGVGQWSDLFYSISFPMSWATSKVIRKKYGNSVLPYIVAGSIITVVANIIVAIYKTYVWKIIPLNCMKVEITAAVIAIVMVEVLVTWVTSKVKKFPLLEH